MFEGPDGYNLQSKGKQMAAMDTTYKITLGDIMLRQETSIGWREKRQESLGPSRENLWGRRRKDS